MCMYICTHRYRLYRLRSVYTVCTHLRLTYDPSSAFSTSNLFVSCLVLSCYSSCLHCLLLSFFVLFLSCVQQSVTCVWKITAECLGACSVICVEPVENYSQIRDVLWASLPTCVNTRPTGKCYTQLYCSVALLWRIRDGDKLVICISAHLIILFLYSWLASTMSDFKRLICELRLPAPFAPAYTKS